MGSPELYLSDHSDVDELLSQLDEESLLELNLNSFRYGGEELVVEDKLDPSDVAETAMASRLSARYQKLQSLFLQSSDGDGVGEGDGAGNTKKVEDEDGDTDAHGDGCEQSPVKNPSPPPVVASKSSCSPCCFCIPAMKMLRRSLRKAASSSNGIIKGDEKQATEDDQSYLEIDFEKKQEVMLVDPRTFNVKEREREFRRVSKKERHLTAEAERLVEWVSSASARMDVVTNDEEMGETEVGRKKQSSLI